HDFVVDIAPDVPRIEADRESIEKILTNLVNNAIKYSPEGGTVTVQVVRHDNGVRLSVQDEGIGIPEDQRGKIFERLETGDWDDTRAEQGPGIGLFMVKHLVEAHGGTIEVESEVGKGSTFTVTLPLHPPPEVLQRQRETTGNQTA
ncbi:MAG TPA: ATP-binding protein, partial [Armatimonadetes bacterium]|nr:ATP-binding protein [Armatimonadota bacterium]